MADVIKGLTVKIGADTSDFIKGIKSADKQINETQKQINELQKSLKLEWDEARFAKVQQLARKQLEQTEEKAEAIRKQLKYLEESGNIDTIGYEKLQTELIKAETAARSTKKQLDEINNLKMSRIQQNIDATGKKIEALGKSLSGISIASGLALVGLTKLGLSAIKTGDDIATLASQYDMSTKAIQQWQYIALQSDISSETFLRSAKKVKSALAEQIQGEVNDSTTALKELNISMQNFSSTEDAFAAIIKEISKLNDVTQKTYYANKIFGENIANELIPLFQQGESAINKYLAEFETVGYLSEEQVNSLANFDNELNILKMQFSQMATEIGVAFLPVLQSVADILRSTVLPLIESFNKWFSELSPNTKNVVAGLLMFVAALGPTLILVGRMISSIQTLIPLLTQLKGLSLSTAIGFATLAGAVALTFDIIGNWKEMSTVEKILKSLALAALVAAAAITVFHASWSLGIAVGAIVAGIAVGLAAINSAKKDLMNDESGSDFTYNPSLNSNSDNNYKIPSSENNYSSSNYYNSETDNSVYNIVVNVDKNEYVTEDELVDKVAKKLTLKLQSRG